MGSVISKVKDFFSSLFSGGIFGKIGNFFKGVFDNIKKTFEVFLDPIFWIVCLLYAILYAYATTEKPIMNINIFPNSLLYIIPCILGFAYFFARKCDKFTYNQVLMGLIMYFIHLAANYFITTIGPFIPIIGLPISVILEIPFIGPFIFCLVSLYPGFIWTSLLYNCNVDAKSLLKIKD